MARQSASLHLASHGQTTESLAGLIKDIVGRAGCDRCGRIAFLHIDFGDPVDQTLGKLGVVGQHLEGIK
jgi:hypothetical protein